MSPIIHIILYIYLIFVLYVFCRKSPSISEGFWKYAFIPIISFALIEGFRYGRGVDYIPYKYRFEHIDVQEESQIVFLWLMQFLNSIDFNYIGAFIVYSFLFITGTFFFIKNTYNRDEAKWMYFFAFLALTMRAENMIRQFIAQPFIFASIPFIFKKKWIPALLLILVAINIHTGVLVQVPLIICSYFFVKRTFNWKIWVITLFVAYYIVPNGILVTFFTNLLSILHLDNLLISESLMHYIENSDRWLGEDSIIEAAEQSFLTMTLQFIFESSVIYSSYKLLIKYPNQKVLFAFNIAVVGFILCRLFHGYEIFIRMFGQMDMYWFVPIGYSFYLIKKYNIKNKSVKLSLFALCIYLIMLWARFVLLNPEAMFFWDCNGFVIY